MADLRHITRDSLTGFNRKRLRGTLGAKLGIVPNSAIFAAIGNPWETTQAEQRREAVDRQRLEYQLRNADKPDVSPYRPSKERDLNAPRYSVTKPLDGPPTEEQQRQLEQFILRRLADAGPLPPVPVDKTKLALEKKIARPARLPGKGKFLKLAATVNRQDKLHKERTAKKRADNSEDKGGTDYGHFSIEKG